MKIFIPILILIGGLVAANMYVEYLKDLHTINRSETHIRGQHGNTQKDNSKIPNQKGD